MAQSQDPVPHPPFHFHLHNRNLTLDEPIFHKSLLTHFKASKSASYKTDYEGQITNQRIHECQKVLLKAQNQLSRVHFTLSILKHNEKKLLLPTIQHFLSLSSLTLQFVGNFQNETLPKEILFKTLASLKNLDHLDLSFLCLIFDDAQTLKNLIKTIRKLKRISSLSLTFYICYRLTSLHYNILLSNLTKITKLRKLRLSFNNSDNLDNAEVEIFAALLSKLAHLTQLDLIFEGQGTILEPTLLRLFHAFQSLKNLKELALNLRGRGFSYCADGGSGSILESLKCLVGSSIQKLSLSLFKNFSIQNLQELSQTLKELTFLKSFSLGIHDWQFFSHNHLVEFDSAFACMTSLTSLSLSFPAQMNMRNIVQPIASALKPLQNLVSLRLDFRFAKEIEDKEFEALFENLKYFKSLKYLDIQIAEKKRMTDISLEALGASLKQLILLRNLCLGFFSVPMITNEGVEAILFGIQEGLSNLFSLSLDFENNENLNEKIMSKLGEALKALASLYSVDLCFQRCLKIVDCKDLFSALRDMKNLQEIELSLPESEENCREISSLKKIRNSGVHFVNG